MFVVTTVKSGVRFYLTSEGFASDIPERAEVFSGLGALEASCKVAADANAEKAWRNSGFSWEVWSRKHVDLPVDIAG